MVNLTRDNASRPINSAPRGSSASAAGPDASGKHQSKEASAAKVGKGRRGFATETAFSGHHSNEIILN